MTTVTTPDTPFTVFCGSSQIVTDNPEFKPNLAIIADCEGNLLRL